MSPLASGQLGPPGPLGVGLLRCTNDEEDRDGLVGGPTITSDAQLGPTIADLDVSGAQDEQGLVEEGARSQ